MKQAKNVGGIIGFFWGITAVSLHHLEANNWAADIIMAPIMILLAALSHLTPHVYKYLFFTGGIAGILSDLLMIVVYSICICSLMLIFSGLFFGPLSCLLTGVKAITQKLSRKS